MRIAAHASTLADAETILGSRTIDVAIVDVRLPDGTAFDLMRRVRDLAEPPAYLMCPLSIWLSTSTQRFTWVPRVTS
jgi:DNA-binding response OmpR family regulator